VLGPDAFMKTRQYQSDYFYGKTGSIEAGPFDIAGYVNDSIVSIGNLTIRDGYLSDFRDQRIPREPGMVTKTSRGNTQRHTYTC